jgi:hypothetical protein
MPSALVCTVHEKLLAMVLKEGEDPDEVRVITELTWPEMLRQVLRGREKRSLVWRTRACSQSSYPPLLSLLHRRSPLSLLSSIWR